MDNKLLILVVNNRIHIIHLLIICVHKNLRFSFFTHFHFLYDLHINCMRLSRFSYLFQMKNQVLRKCDWTKVVELDHIIISELLNSEGFLAFFPAIVFVYSWLQNSSWDSSHPICVAGMLEVWEEQNGTCQLSKTSLNNFPINHTQWNLLLHHWPKYITWLPHLLQS